MNITGEISSLVDILNQNDLKFITRLFRKSDLTIKVIITRNRTLEEKLSLFSDVKYICPVTFKTYYGKIINIGNGEEVTVMWNDFYCDTDKSNTSTFQFEYALKKLIVLKPEKE